MSSASELVAVLECFDADQTEWQLSALARHLGRPTSTLHEQLATLVSSGLLLKTGRGRYRLGWRLLKLSSALYSSIPWYAAAHDAMNALARRTHVLAFLCVLEGSQVLCIARSVQGRAGEMVAGETQFVLPPHASASGKLLYALHGLSPAPDAPLFTLHTLARPWPEEAAEIRRTKLAYTQGDWSVGTSGLAAPIVGADSEVLAALGLSFSTARHPHPEGLVRQLQQAAEDCSWG